MNRVFVSKRIERRLLLAMRRYPLQIIGAGLVGVMFAVILIAGLVMPSHGQTVRNALSESNQLPALNGVGSTLPVVSFADLVDKVEPAVVTIRSERKVTPQAQQMPFNDDLMRQFFGGRVPQMNQAPQVERGLGSGVIIESNGTILTNNHVVDGAQTVKVDLPDKRTFEAKIVGTDPASDLAVLKIEADNLPTLTLGDSDKVRVGDVVLAFGNPLGLRQTVTSGIISAKGRQTGLSDGSFEDFLQTDAPINQGNSGGALVNTNGELIGINSQILSPSGGSIGIGFAIPSNMARSVTDQILKDGKVHRGMLGIGIQDVTSDLAENFGLKEVRGVVVNTVTQGSPAEKAGIKQGDVITKLNGNIISDGNELRNKVAQTAPGTAVTIGIIRNGGEVSATATLGEFHAKNESPDNPKANADTGNGKLGMSIEPLTPHAAAELGLDGQTGLLVTDVQPGSPADDAGIAPGDLIVEVNRQAVKTIADMQGALGRSKAGSALLLVSRKGQTRFVTVRN